MSDFERAAQAVREDRLWQRHMDMAKLGGTPRGGVNRQALSAEDAAARNLLMSWAAARGFSVFTDVIGNLFVRREGSDAGAKPILSGSHMDSQPTGGRFDGMYGVLAAFEALEALEDAGVRTKRPVEAVAWTNEEGSRFQPGAMGSAVFAGHNALDAMLAVKDWKGVVLRDALAETLAAAPAPRRGDTPGFALDGYVEAHIEQGPRLEDARTTIGVVTGIQGSRRFMVEILGDEAHAGTTPRAARKDAFVAAVAIAGAMQDATRDADDTLRFTIGRVDVLPGSPNTVPGRVSFTIDMRHPSMEVLEAHETKLRAIVASKAAPCTATIERLTSVAPTVFDPGVIGLVRDAAQRQGFSNMDMPSGAGHDAMHIAALCPAGMVFVPCERGVSHNEIENATPSDLAAGTRVLVEALVRLANR
ncbi:Zn-dependent hydrolase [Reyranella sp. CPCC 100927]|uniref:Zn-dependent hydrolase n=1 Tax=Reyranella sp. CPCC 100927 TaxID=2599616 RepID=UPI0011B7E3C0|nr:Zn-dependent hydrolase [Reyranella sp. CPCC 100927]TWT06011.1 Zn-dependent hydrolase [Reyranella sp. CPCC 100927]